MLAPVYSFSRKYTYVHVLIPYSVTSVMSDSLQPHGLYWSSCHALFQGIFSTQRSNPHLLCLLHCKQILYLLSHQGSPMLCTFYHNWKESLRSHTRNIGRIMQVWLRNLITWVLRKVTRGSPFLQAGQTQACGTPGSVYTYWDLKVWAGLCSAGFVDRESLTLAFLTKI